MDGSLGGGFSGHNQNCFDSSGRLRVSFSHHLSLLTAYILQAPYFERRGDNQREIRHPTVQPRGRGHGTHPITPQPIVVNQGYFLGPSFAPAPYANPVNNTDGFFHGTPQRVLSNTIPLRHPPAPRNHHHPHTQSSPLISGHTAFNLGGSYNMEAASRVSPLDVTQASQEGIGASSAAVGSIQPPPLSPQGGSIDVFPNQRRMHSLPCPVSGCTSSLSRTQDQRRHLLTHLPHWIHCPAPDCIWRGDRFNAFVRHWGNDHPSGNQVPNESQCKTYDPQPLMKAIYEGTLCIQDAQNYAISMVKNRALQLRKLELSEDPWGSKWKRLRNSDQRHMVSTS